MPRCGSRDPGPAAADDVIAAVARWRAAAPGPAGVLVLAIDGHGGSGKSTVAAAVAGATRAALVHTDDFFRAGQAPQGIRRPLESYYDWRRLRAQALEPLRARRQASFRRFDWDRGTGLDGLVTVDPAGLIVVEGVFSAAPQLADQVDRAVFVDTPEPERLRRLRGRIAPEEWDDEWLLAEQAYFRLTRPPPSFDLIVYGTDPAPEMAPR
jgi:uridine kinase